MPIDMDNMLAGFSNQLIGSSSAEIDFGDGAQGPITVAVSILRAEDVLDVGFVVTEPITLNDPAATIEIGRRLPGGGQDNDHFVTYSLTDAIAAGTVLRVSDGSLSWTANADTEANRLLALGTTVTFTAGTGTTTGKIAPFVIMRPQGPLDPIA